MDLLEIHVEKHRVYARRVAFFHLICSYFGGFYGFILTTVWWTTAAISTLEDESHQFYGLLPALIEKFSSGFAINLSSELAWLLIAGPWTFFALNLIWIRFSILLVKATSTKVNSKQALKQCRSWKRFNNWFTFYAILALFLYLDTFHVRDIVLEAEQEAVEVEKDDLLLHLEQDGDVPKVPNDLEFRKFKVVFYLGTGNIILAALHQAFNQVVENYMIMLREKCKK